MSNRPGASWLRDNLFLAAAVVLPVVVLAFFLLASAVPRWLVAPPAHDLVFRVSPQYSDGRPRISVDYAVRDGRVEATARPVAANGYPEFWSLFLLDHATLTVRELQVELPASLDAGAPPQAIAVQQLAGRRIVAGATAPDGYALASRDYRGPGLVGEIFGGGRSDPGFTLVNRSRVVHVVLPPPYEYQSALPVGWVVETP